MTRNPRIFVQIASYRDPECRWTIKDLFDKAARPERVFVGVCLQYDPKEDGDCGIDPHPRVRAVEYHPKDSKGAGWARNEAQKLRQGEEYTLQIQAHMRFEQGWDDTLIAALEALPSKKSVLTAWLPGYAPPDEKEPLGDQFPMMTLLRFGGAEDAQMIHFTRTLVPQKDVLGQLLPSAFWIGNFMFTRSETLQNVPFDPTIYFWGEEINYSVRLWTHGYDIFHLDRVVLYHYWTKPDSERYRDHFSSENQRSLARNLHLLGLKHSDTETLGEYGLGTVRSLADFWKFSRLDLPRWWRDIHSEQPQIFVAIASYRDPELRYTIKDLFEKSHSPQRIRVGVCNQGEETLPHDWAGRVRIKQVPAEDSKGAGWARAEAHKLRQKEAYVLQIDSHMRFEAGWDNALIQMLERAPSQKPVISGYASNYEPPNTRFTQPGETLRVCVRALAGEGDPQLVHLTGTFVPEGELYPSPFVIMNFLFARAGCFDEVPVDPHFAFYGDEISHAARLWTHGWDVFQPERTVLYHYWLRQDEMHKHHYRDVKNEANQRSLERVRQLLRGESKEYGLGTARQLADWWLITGVDLAAHTVKPWALDGQWHAGKDDALAAFYHQQKPALAPKPALPEVKQDGKIFVQIASYRDPECQWTVKDLFEKAENPERIAVGICWQFDHEKDAACFQVVTRPEQVRVLPVDWRESQGVCWARHQTQPLWEGEEYTLQIDSHMRFVQGWDRLLIEELALCKAAKPLLSCNPAPYTPPDNLFPEPIATIRRVLPFQSDGNIRGRGETLDRLPEQPLNAAFIAAGFVFARSEMIREVPYDPYMYFDQEEICYAARLYTHGWDVFSTRRHYLYHYYNTERDSARPLHWNDLAQSNRDMIYGLRMRGLMRFNHLFGHTLTSDLHVIHELEHYGFGTVRTLAQYEEYCGIDFKRKIASERALTCLFIKNLHRYLDRTIAALQPEPFSAHAAFAPLGVGDFMPFFELPGTNNMDNSIEVRGGHCSILFVVPFAQHAYVKQVYERMLALSHNDEMVKYTFVFDAPVSQLVLLKEKLPMKPMLMADPEHRLAQAIGFDAAMPTAFVLNHDMRIVSRHSNMQADAMAEALLADWARTMQQFHAAPPAIITRTTPAHIVSDVLPPAFIDKSIHAFRTGYVFDGTVGAEDKHAYMPGVKVRTDHVVQGELLAEMDEMFSRRLFPEIQKIYGFEVTYREPYKIGLYKAENQGGFRRHRDNFMQALGYRRIAMTLHLTDDFEGGGLRFPEYGPDIFRPGKGSAVLFPGSVLHEALPVTKGERYIIVGFFHGDEDEVYRRDYLASKGEDLRLDTYRLKRNYKPEIKQSRWFRKGK